MQLHRSLSHEWTTIPASQRTKVQQLAHWSNGVLTPANGISTVGAALVVTGLIYLIRDQLVIGLVFIVVGRAADLLDGYVAHRTQTKSPVGEAVDASIDKLEAFLTIVAVLYANLVPPVVGVVILLHTIFGLMLYLLAQHRGGRIHPGKWGKYATAVEWFVLACYIVAHGAPSGVHNVFQVVGWISFISFVSLALAASKQYVYDYYQLRSDR